MVHTEAEACILALHNTRTPLCLRLSGAEGYLELPVTQKTRHERHCDDERELASEARAWAQPEVRQIRLILNVVPPRGVVPLRIGEQARVVVW